MIDKTLEQLRDEEVARRALEAAAKAVESRAGNAVYRRAWIIAAEVIRSMKPF
jgi:hypothetical protein